MRAYLKLSVIVLAAAFVQWLLSDRAAALDEAQLTVRVLLHSCGAGSEADLRAAADAFIRRDRERCFARLERQLGPVPVNSDISPACQPADAVVALTADEEWAEPPATDDATLYAAAEHGDNEVGP